MHDITQREHCSNGQSCCFWMSRRIIWICLRSSGSLVTVEKKARARAGEKLCMYVYVCVYVRVCVCLHVCWCACIKLMIRRIIWIGLLSSGSLVAVEKQRESKSGREIVCVRVCMCVCTCVCGWVFVCVCVHASN